MNNKYIKLAVLASALFIGIQSTQAAPGMTPKAKIQVLKRYNESGASLLSDALSAYKSAISTTTTVKYHAADGHIILQPTTVTVVTDPREEPDAPVATNFILVDGDIFKIGAIDITDVKKAGDDQILLSGSGGYYFDGEKNCWPHIARQIKVQFSRSAKSGLKAEIISQKDNMTCD